MPQIKIEKTGGYTAVSNTVLQNPALSLKAKGLLLYMLSLPEDWDYSISGLASKCKEGPASIRGAIKELMEAGHIVRRLARGEDGRLDGYEYTVYEAPPSCEKPTTDNPSTENRTQQNKNLTKEELNKTPCSPPQGDRAGRSISQPKHTPEIFEELWIVYPRKKGRQDACRAWDKLRPDRELARRMYRAVLRQRLTPQWSKDGGQYIPHLSRWINGRLWEDEVEPAAPPGWGGWAEDPEVTG